MKKTLSVLCIVAFVLIGGVGCMSKQQANGMALDKFEEKYGVEYEVKYTEMIPDSVENRDEIHVYVPSLMNENESAIIYSWVENGEAVSSDNLFGFVIRDEFEDTIASEVTARFGDAKVYTTFVNRRFDDSLGLNSTLTDAYDAGEKVIASSYVVALTDLPEETFQALADDVANKLKNKQHFGSMTFYPVSNFAEFESITRENCQDKVDMFARYADVCMPYNAYENRSYDMTGEDYE